jgi:hypothetical protein
MAIRYRTPHYLVLVDGAFDESGVWIIDAHVILARLVDVAARAKIIEEIKRAVFLGIVEESRRGKALGAREIRISADPIVVPTSEQNLLDA